MKIKISFIVLGLVLLVLSPLIQAQDYSLDYGVSGVSGIVWETADYKIVDLVSELGVSQGSQTSTDYSVAPVIGMEDEPPNSVKDWMLY